ncbi:MAG: hypothetical protein ABF743_10590 [Schleiferilactobacillus perolens]|uniref:hypothetical protein n=1 Tax=Schleiferilactobacillus perolens TaxID=100468 RepID=UPI0039E92CDE
MRVELEPVSTDQVPEIFQHIRERLVANQMVTDKGEMINQITPWPGYEKTEVNGIRVFQYIDLRCQPTMTIVSPIITDESYEKVSKRPLWLVILLCWDGHTDQLSLAHLATQLHNEEVSQELRSVPPSLLSAAIRGLMAREN